MAGTAPAARTPEPEGRPRVSIIVPAYNEGEHIIPFLDRLFEGVSLPCEVFVVYDRPEDTTLPVLEKYATDEPRLVPILNEFGPGPANAIRYGIGKATADVVCVMAADGADDPRQVDDLTRLVERGVVVAAASRYMPGGQQVGGPRMKGFLSKLAGRSLYWLCNIGTRDATNNFRAYSRAFLEDVGLDSRDGFEIGLELVSKARRLRLPIAEIPTIWLDRQAGISNFKLASWIPRYLHWYFFSFGPKLPLAELRRRVAADTEQSASPT